MTPPERLSPEGAAGPVTTSTTFSVPPRGRYLAGLCLGALGVVYGDIGTSPLYALRECFHGPHAVTPTPGNVLGVLSLIFWSLVVVISIKYLVFVMRADNRGEGGILALMSLLRSRVGEGRARGFALIALGLFGAALLYGDGIITPAISVLSAVEGLRVATPVLEPYVIPITIAILLGLFLSQQTGTRGLGRVFGPLMIVWFATLALLGAAQVARAPEVLAAINPVHAVRFFAENQWRGFLTLGSVFLVVTGGEALYADMGHFGVRPIRIAWFSFVLPALLVNYFGQGALLLGSPAAAESPFYRMGPAWAHYPLVVLATAATCIASQAVISGSFSLTRQAVQLGYLPRTRIEHTSEREIGQIYVPVVNWVLMAACIALVLEFRSSSSMAAAYGVAVTTTMAITTILFAFVARSRWGWKPGVVALAGVLFLAIDLCFFGANIVKVADGGWFPLVVATVVFTAMTTWRRGRRILNDRLQEETLPDETFLESVARRLTTRVRGTAVYMDRTFGGVPPSLLHNLKHNKVLHERVVFLTVLTEEQPYVSKRHRLDAKDLGQGFYRLVLRYGFMEDPDVPLGLSHAKVPGLAFPPTDTTYFLGKETLLPTKRPGMALWRERIFAIMSRNAFAATAFFRLPPNRVVELGAQIEL